MHDHTYQVSVDWTGDRGTGTSGYREYGRDHVVSAAGKHDLAGSADPTFRGDRDRWNPEELLTAALAQCHMLSYLHVAVTQGFTVLAYEDTATATLNTNRDGSGELTSATLHPVVTIAEPDRVADAEAARRSQRPLLHRPLGGVPRPPRTGHSGARSGSDAALGADSSTRAAD